MYRPLEKRNPGKKPFKFKTPAELQKATEQYFNYCDENKKPYTVSGLARHIGTSRQTLIDYQNRDEFEDVILDAKRRVEQYMEECLYTKQNPAGVIFSAKNNFSWKDKQEIDTSINLNAADMIKRARSRVEEIDDGTIDIESKESDEY